MKPRTTSKLTVQNISLLACTLLLAFFTTGCVIETDGNGGLSGGMCLDQSCTTTCVNDVCDTVCSANDCLPSDDAMEGSCHGMCGMMNEGLSCQCDAACVENGDCCADFEPMCIGGTHEEASGVVVTQTTGDSTSDRSRSDATLSCAERCGAYDANATCQCDSECALQGDCCADLALVCEVSTVTGTGRAASTNSSNANSCQDRCDTYNKEATCQCDDKCVENNDCCTDAASLCKISSATSTPKPTPAANSCVERCGEYSKEATCQCDAKCAENNDCCTDLPTVCSKP